MRERLAIAVSPLVALSKASAAETASGGMASTAAFGVGAGGASSSSSTSVAVGGGVGMDSPMRWSPLGRHGMMPSSK